MSSLPPAIAQSSVKVQALWLAFLSGMGICKAARHVGLSEDYACRVKSKQGWDQIRAAQNSEIAENLEARLAEEALGTRRRAVDHARDVSDLVALLTDEVAERDPETGRLVRLKKIPVGVDRNGDEIMSLPDAKVLNALAATVHTNFKTQHVATGEAQREKLELSKASKRDGPQTVVVLGNQAAPDIKDAKQGGVFDLPAESLPPPAAGLPDSEVPEGDPLG